MGRNPHMWLYFVANPSMRLPKPGWDPSVRPTRRMLMLYTAEYMDLVAKRKHAWKRPKIAGVIGLVALGGLNVVAAVADHSWLALLWLACVAFIVWIEFVYAPIWRRLDTQITELKQGADGVRALVKTRAATWLDEPADGGEQL